MVLLTKLKAILLTRPCSRQDSSQLSSLGFQYPIQSPSKPDGEVPIGCKQLCFTRFQESAFLVAGSTTGPLPRGGFKTQIPLQFGFPSHG